MREEIPAFHGGIWAHVNATYESKGIYSFSRKNGNSEAQIIVNFSPYEIVTNLQISKRLFHHCEGSYCLRDLVSRENLKVRHHSSDIYEVKMPAFGAKVLIVRR